MAITNNFDFSGADFSNSNNIIGAGAVPNRRTRTEAYRDLMGAGPGAICDACGHFAGRHQGLVCLFPRDAGHECACPGMTWIDGHVFEMRPSGPKPDED